MVTFVLLALRQLSGAAGNDGKHTGGKLQLLPGELADPFGKASRVCKDIQVNGSRCPRSQEERSWPY